MVNFIQKFNKDSLFLVTGGAGFIGSHLCEYLVNNGFKVRCLDNLSNGKMENLSSIIQNDNFEFIEGDIRDFDTCLKVTSNVDYVLHQAAWGSVPKSIEMPLIYEEINIKGTLNMLEASKINRVKKFVFASSSSVYGDSPILPKIEGNEGDLLSPYALTKKVDEYYAFLYKKLYGLDTYGLRYFNIFGERQNPQGQYAAVIPKFVSLISKNESPEIYGNGYQSRDFTYVENVVQANLLCCLASSNDAGQSFNIACGGQTNLLSLYEEISKYFNKKPKIIFREPRIGDIQHSNADISKAKRILGYNPIFSFEEGMKKYLEWWISHND